jgi:hypothetical protein
MIAWAGAERLALGLTDMLDARPHARWLLSDVTGPPKTEVLATPPSEPGSDAQEPPRQEPPPP